MGSGWVDLVPDLVYSLTRGPSSHRYSLGVVCVSAYVNIHEAKTQLSKLLARVMQGEEIVIARAGKPVARLVPITQRSARRVPGTAKGKITIAPDFDAPLPESILAEFEQ